MSDNQLSTLALFPASTQLLDINPHHFAKLLSLALIEQKEGGPELTESGIARLNYGHTNVDSRSVASKTRASHQSGEQD